GERGAFDLAIAEGDVHDDGHDHLARVGERDARAALAQVIDGGNALVDRGGREEPAPPEPGQVRPGGLFHDPERSAEHTSPLLPYTTLFRSTGSVVRSTLPSLKVMSMTTGMTIWLVLVSVTPERPWPRSSTEATPWSIVAVERSQPRQNQARSAPAASSMIR